MNPPANAPMADTVLIESTYGDREHPHDKLLDELGPLLKAVATRGGVAVVPVFAVGMGDEFGVSGTGEACMEHFGLTARGIADRAREALVLKPIVSHPPLHGPEWT